MTLVTKYHKYQIGGRGGGGAFNTRNLSSGDEASLTQFWRLRVQGQGVGRAGFCGGLPLAGRHPLLALSPRGLSSGHAKKASSSYMRTMTSSNLNSFLKVLSPDTVTLEGKASTHGFGREGRDRYN